MPYAILIDFGMPMEFAARVMSYLITLEDFLISALFLFNDLATRSIGYT
jgi:hypothetical protein